MTSLAPPPWVDGARRGAATFRARGPRVLVVTGLALGGVAALGAWNPGSFVLLARSTDHFFALSTLALLAFFVGGAWGGHRLWLRLGFAGTGAAVLTAWLFMAWLVGPFTGVGDEETAVPAPGGAYRAVARDDQSAIVDPVTDVSIEQTTGLLARRWGIGCLSGDLEEGLAGFRWRDATHLLVIGVYRTYPVTVDAGTGEPQSVPEALSC